MKQDPETLALRGRPRPAVRFRRGLIIGGAAAAAAALIGVTWAALEPPSFRAAAGAEADGSSPNSAPDALANAPSSYGEVPQLGPPLPGDLGRPILEHQRRVEAAEPVSAIPAQGEAERARAMADAERQRLASAREAARASGVLIRLAGVERLDGSSSSPGGGSSAPADTAPTASRAEGQQRSSEVAPATSVAVSRHRLTDLPSRWVLSAGTLISASLITGLNSDLPGMVLAQVTENVRDSATGREVLLPQGSRLVGNYDNSIAFGQRRALLVWRRIILPDGSSVELDDMPATDAAGFAGVEDRVDFHTGRLLKGIMLSTLLGVGTELGLGGGETELVRAIRESTQQNAARAGDKVTQRNLDVQPTLTVRPGWPVRAIVHKDLVLRPWRG
jgi:type IV secretion system protein VirB10